MNEVLDAAAEDPSSATPSIDILEQMKDKHLPNFKFDQYPLISEADDPLSSPRMRDEEWSQYESQSKVESSATQLRQNPQLLDKIIQTLQITG